MSVPIQVLRDDGSQELECLHCRHSAVYDGDCLECRGGGGLLKSTIISTAGTVLSMMVNVESAGGDLS